MLGIRRFSATPLTRAAAKQTKGKAPPKKAARQTFSRKPKSKDSSSGGAVSALSQQIGSSKPLAKLNPAAPKLTLRQAAPSEYTRDNVGAIVETPTEITTQLLALDVLQSQGGYQYFSQLATVIRKVSVDLAQVLLEQSGPSTGRRVILDGPGGGGKSVATLQAIALALAQRWVVVSIPRAEALVDNSEAYAWSDKSSSWRQDGYMSNLLGRVAEANKQVLQLQNLSKTCIFDRHTIPEKATLYKLLEIGANDANVAHAIYDTFLEEMNLEGRPQLLMTLDNLSVATVLSKYRNPKFEAIHPFDLRVLGDFISYLNGTRSLTNGVVLANTSSRPACRDRALQVVLGHAIPSPFETIDERIANGIRGARVITVGEYNAAEATSIIRHYASAGLMRGYSTTDVTASLVKQRTMMGGALGREVFRSCLKQL